MSAIQVNLIFYITLVLETKIIIENEYQLGLELKLPRKKFQEELYILYLVLFLYLKNLKKGTVSIVDVKIQVVHIFLIRVLIRIDKLRT